MDFCGRRFVSGELDGGEDWSEVARAMGADGVRVNQLEDVSPALTVAIDAQMNTGRTTVLDVMCTKELGDPFRKDALSRPVHYSLARYLTSAGRTPLGRLSQHSTVWSGRKPHDA